MHRIIGFKEWQEGFGKELFEVRFRCAQYPDVLALGCKCAPLVNLADVIAAGGTEDALTALGLLVAAAELALYNTPHVAHVAELRIYAKHLRRAVDQHTLRKTAKELARQAEEYEGALMQQQDNADYKALCAARADILVACAFLKNTAHDEVDKERWVHIRETVAGSRSGIVAFFETHQPHNEQTAAAFAAMRKTCGECFDIAEGVVALYDK